MKTINQLIINCKTLEIIGSLKNEVSSIHFDSRNVTQGSMYVAQKGTHIDGHLFIDDCISKGSIAIVCEELPKNIQKNITYIKVENSSFALGYIASAFFNEPSKKIKLIGITGTNGKTTTVTLLHKLFLSLGFNCGLISTVCNKINDTILPSTHTTPDAINLNILLAEMADNGCDYVFMEVSSHAVVQNRIAGLEFSGAIFSNLTHDHLDYHKTFDEYLKAKKQFFDNLSTSAFALTNIDDRNGEVMLQNSKAKKYTYSTRAFANFRCRIMENQFHGLCLDIDNTEVWFKLVGKFNAYNIMAVYGTACLLGIDKHEILEKLSGLDSAEGRFEYIRNNEGITAIVDYAHTPDALENVLNTIHDICNGNETIITVIGCGGDRDPLKRPEMAKIACKLSNKVILTSDNPRTEDPNLILEQMKSGIDIVSAKRVLTIENRREAIKTACSLANSGDVILVAGKGHEKYQEVNGVRTHFDDKEELINFLNN